LLNLVFGFHSFLCQKIITNMKNVLFLFAFCFTTVMFSQETKLTGQVKDGDNANEPLAFASVTVKEIDAKTYTDQEGKFSLELAPGTYTLVYEFIGYAPVEIKNFVMNSQNSSKDITLRAHTLSSTKELALN